MPVPVSQDRAQIVIRVTRWLEDILRAIQVAQALGPRCGIRERGEVNSASCAAAAGQQHQPPRTTLRQHQHIIRLVFGAT